jgi:hypothetical protein
MGMLAPNLTLSVATVRRKLLRMMDVLAESGMRHAHREISRGYQIDAKQRKKVAGGKRRARAKDEAVH